MYSSNSKNASGIYKQYTRLLPAFISGFCIMYGVLEITVLERKKICVYVHKNENCAASCIVSTVYR